MWGFQENVIAFLNEELIGGQEELLKWAMDNHGYRDFRSAFKNSFQISLVHSFVAAGFLRTAVKCKAIIVPLPSNWLKRPKTSDFY